MDIPPNRRILVIDDNGAIHHDFRKILAPSGDNELPDLDDLLNAKEAPKREPAAGFDLEFALQGQEGYEKAESALENGKPFAVAFVDMRMPPGWDGLETIVRLWELDPRLQTVICSAFSDYSWSQIFDRLGKTDRLLILKKPFDMAEVLQVASALTEKWDLARRAEIQTGQLERMVEQRTQELRTSNEELRRTNERLHEMYQVENERNHLRDSVSAMEQVLGVIGHELRTPLAGLRCSAEFLMKDKRFQEDQARILVGGIHDSAMQMSQTLEHLLEAARLNSGNATWNWGTVDLEKVCDEALDSVRPLVDHAKVRLELKVEPADLAMAGDAEAVRRLVQNLVSNSRRHTATGEISVSVTAEGEWVVLRVRDSGEGIPPQILSVLGVPFALSHAAVGERCVGGAGLGLSICRSIVAAHGGQMRVESEPGKGTLVTARLRADLQEPARQQNPQSLRAA